MSWKGLQKAVNRLPYQLLSKKDEGTKDAEYMQLEKLFKELTKLVELLIKDATIFRDGISALLSNQAAMAQYLATIYDSALGTQVAEGMVRKRFQQTPANQLQAANDADAAMAYCQEEVLPVLDLVDQNVTRPLLELSDIIKTISKTMVKRNHKLIDFDRHRIAIQKLNAKPERSFSEEKQIFKVQSQLDTATQDYNYLNDMLKKELALFFQLKASFIEPVFKNLFNMQTRIYGMIYARCLELMNQNMETFVTNTMGIEEGYNYRKSQRDIRAEFENMDLLKSGGKAWLVASGAANSSKLTLQERAALKAAEASEGKGGVGVGDGGGFSPNMGNDPYYNQNAPAAPPAYGQTGLTLESSPIGYEKQRRHPVAQQQHVVVALYDYTAQADGDLSFRKDDRIEIVEKTNDTNDWWTGRMNGITGVFPGNYVQEL